MIAYIYHHAIAYGMPEHFIPYILFSDVMVIPLSRGYKTKRIELQGRPCKTLFADFSTFKIKRFAKNSSMLKRFFIYGLIGWCIEVIFTGLGSLAVGDLGLSSSTNLWMFPIYGTAVFLEPLHDLMRLWKWPFRGLLWVVIIWGIEYATGLLLVSVLGIYAWEYTGIFAVDGLVNLSFAPAWFIAGLLFERAHRLLDKYGIA